MDSGLLSSGEARGEKPISREAVSLRLSNPLSYRSFEGKCGQGRRLREVTPFGTMMELETPGFCEKKVHA